MDDSVVYVQEAFDQALLGELKYEFDSLYVSTEIVLSPKYKEHPLDGLLFEACLLHFRVIWDFFYANNSDFTVRSVIPAVAIKNGRPKPPKRLNEIRSYLNVMLAHISTERITNVRKVQQPLKADFEAIRSHTEALFLWFVAELAAHQKSSLTNPLAWKFAKYTTLRVVGEP